MFKILMCPPKFFDIEYEINPWMHEEAQVDPGLAIRQWGDLKKIYQSLNCEVFELPPQKGWPDLVFTANAGLFIPPNKIILSNFRYPERQGEALFNERWFLKNGYEVIQPQIPFEGQGEAFFWNDKILAGYGFRSNEQTAGKLQKLSGKEVIQLQLIDPRFYHIDMALAPITKNLIVYNPKAFSEDALSKIKSLNCELIEVNQHDADIFGANLVPLENTVIMVKGTTGLARDLKNKNFKVVELDMSEFRKSGGGVRCLTLNLN